MSGIVERIRHVSDNTNFSLDTKVITAKLELTGICPMQCSFCYNKIMKEKNERQRIISDYDFKLMLDAMDELGTIKEVGLFYMGESTIHPKLCDYYRILKNRGYYTYLTTNLFVNTITDAIPYIDSIKVSWNYRNENDFKDTIKSDNWKNTMNNLIKNIKNLYVECHKNGHTLSISSVLRPGDTTEDYCKYMKLLPHDEWYFLPMQSQGGLVDLSGRDGVVGDFNKQVSPLPCWSLFNGFYVDCELNVRTCCYGNDSKHILMNLTKDKFTKEEYYARKKEYMKMHLHHKIPNICTNCLKDQEEGD